MALGSACRQLGWGGEGWATGASEREGLGPSATGRALWLAELYPSPDVHTV